jgi:hypothetical protein
MDDEVGDKHDEEMNALLDDLDGAFAWTDSFCADAISSDFVKEASPCGLICESSEVTSATTSGKVADFIREEQRKLQGLKSKSGGAEIVASAAIKITKWGCPEDGWIKPEDGWRVWDPHIPNRLLAGLPAADLGARCQRQSDR